MTSNRIECHPRVTRVNVQMDSMRINGILHAHVRIANRPQYSRGLNAENPRASRSTMPRKRDLKKEPYLEPPTRPMFQTLPTELLHVIFSQLPTRNVLALRKTCSLFASVGIDYLGDEVPLVFHRDKFTALKEIAAHPKLAKQMRSLFYVIDRCRSKDYDIWDNNRPDPRPWEEDDWDRTAKSYTDRDFRMFAREGRKSWQMTQERKASVPEIDAEQPTRLLLLCVVI